MVRPANVPKARSRKVRNVELWISAVNFKLLPFYSPPHIPSKKSMAASDTSRIQDSWPRDYTYKTPTRAATRSSANVHNPRTSPRGIARPSTCRLHSQAEHNISCAGIRCTHLPHEQVSFTYHGKKGNASISSKPEPWSNRILILPLSHAKSTRPWDGERKPSRRRPVELIRPTSFPRGRTRVYSQQSGIRNLAN